MGVKALMPLAPRLPAQARGVLRHPWTDPATAWRPPVGALGPPTQATAMPAGTLTARAQVLLGVEVALKHALIEEHVAHGLRNNDVHLLGQRDLLHLPRDDHDAVGEVVTFHQDLRVGRSQGSRTVFPLKYKYPLSFFYNNQAFSKVSFCNSLVLHPDHNSLLVLA